MARTFVTGGSGFIGGALVRRLVADGHEVRALVRSDRAAEIVAGLGAEPVHGELTVPGTWRDYVHGTEVLFHLAAETNTTAEPARHQRITVDGTRAAVEVAAAVGVSTFVLCSTEAALMAGDPLVDIDETAPLRPDSPAPYSAAKAQAEIIVLEADAPGLRTVAVRPRFVWGPESNLISGLASTAKAGEFAWIEGAHQITDVTFVDNAVEGLILGWQHGRGGEAYFVTDEDRVELRTFLGTLFSFVGIEGPIPDIDAPTAVERIPVPDRWFLGQTCTLRTDKARNELGYAPVVSRQDALAATERWAATAG